MARDYTLGLTVVYKVRDEASKSLQQVKGSTDKAKESFELNSQSLRTMGMNATVIGITMLSLGQYLEKTNNESAKGIGQMLSFAGATLTSIGAAAHFVAAIIGLTRALRNTAVAQALVNALAGPVGWAVLAGSLAVGAGAAVAINQGILPGFAAGGIVPGGIGQPMAAIVHGGEQITPAGGAGVTVVFQGGTFMGNESEARMLARRIGEILNEEQRTRRSGPVFGSL